MSVFDAFVRLEGTLDGSVISGESMARHTTYCIGGPAALYVECASVPDLALTCDVLLEEGVRWSVVGKGSNLLVSDEGFDGAVIVLGKGFAACDFGELEKDDTHENALEPGQDYRVSAGAGVALATLVEKAGNYGLSGLEFACGIPGTVGGAVFMNAGSGDTWIESRVSTCTVYKPGEGLRIIYSHDIDWEYRASNLPADEIIVEAAFNLKTASADEIEKRMKMRYDERALAQPLSQRSCGSVFKNPPDRSAASLIRGCGLAGKTRGGAQISTLHANFIVSDGSATAADVCALIELARDRVKETYGIELRPEVRFLGFPEKPE